jgi:hypothetical protein
MNGLRPAGRSDEAGQTSTEYVAVTAVAVLIAMSIILTLFVSSLSSAIADVGQGLLDFVEDNF